MTQKDFLCKIRAAYINARELSCNPKTNNNIIHRGTSHSISSYSEDLFGCYCAEKIENKNNIKILIDPPITFKGTNLKNASGKKVLLVRPDVAIINNNVANLFFDIKTDLGFIRKEFKEQLRKKNTIINSIKQVHATYKNGQTKKERKIQISSDIKLVYVVISGGNIGENKLNEIKQEVQNLDNIEIFILSKEEHLNSYSNNFSLKVNENDFKKLDKTIKEFGNK